MKRFLIYVLIWNLFVQEPPPKTEDQRHEDAEVLMMLGDDAQGSELRAQIMSPLLLSDMEAFKVCKFLAISTFHLCWLIKKKTALSGFGFSHINYMLILYL